VRYLLVNINNNFYDLGNGVSLLFLGLGVIGFLVFEEELFFNIFY
jgi:hypothetical protein